MKIPKKYKYIQTINGIKISEYEGTLKLERNGTKYFYMFYDINRAIKDFNIQTMPKVLHIN